MAITSFSRVLASPESGGDAFSVANRSASRDRSPVYQAITSSQMSVDDLLADPLMPRLGATYDFNPLCRLQNRQAVRHADNPKVWTVTLTYSTEMPKPEEIEDDNPLNAPVKRSIGYHEIQVPMRKDLDGNTIKLTNGLPVNPPPMVRRSVLVFRFTKNYPTFDIATYTTYHDHVSSDSFMGLAAGTVYCQLSAEEMFRKGEAYIAVSWEFSYDPRGWQPQLVNQSLYQREIVGDKTVPILDERFLPVTEPWPLTSGGRAIGASDLLTTAPAVTQFKGYATVDFNDIGLPTAAP